jgi:GNAT superfamily N-acetyltransferase
VERVISSLEIRQAQEADADAIVRCLAAAFAPYREQYTPAAFADTVLDDSAIRERMRTMHVLVAVSAAQIVGTVAASVKNEQEGHLRGMALLPQFRRTGVAAQLLSAVEDYLRIKGCKRVSLDTTLPLQTAINFYEKHSYVRSGRVTDFFGMPLIEYVKSLERVPRLMYPLQ